MLGGTTMKIDLTCPVELWQYAMPTEEDADCTFIMNNLKMCIRDRV